MPGKLRDRMWLWGTVVNALAKDYGFPESRITIGEGLAEFSLSNAMMAGFLPPAEDEYAAVAHCDSLLWEMSFEDGFAFEEPVGPIVELHERHENVRGVLLDDFSTTEISKGATPDVLERMRAALPESFQLWIVVYGMSLDIPNLSEFLKHVDGVSFWVWNARDLPLMREQVARCNEMSAGKPMVLGNYLYDFGDGAPLTRDQMTMQLDVSAELVRAGECEGLCLLGSPVMDIGLESIAWTKEWIQQNGSMEV